VILYLSGEEIFRRNAEDILGISIIALFFRFFTSMKRCLFLIFLLSLQSSLRAQEYLFPLNNEQKWRVAEALESDSNHFHTSMQPWGMDALRKIIPVDTIVKAELKDSKLNSTGFARKLRKEHLLILDKDDLFLTLDPLFNFEVGRDTKAGRNVYVNTRGLLLQARAGQKFYVYTGLYENQARYVNYVDKVIRDNGVVPGQGRVKTLQDEVFDFNSAFGGIGFTPSKHFDMQLAQDKNFIGDGYRSLLLSDNAFSYPFLRLTAKFWKIQYMVLYTLMQDLKLPYDYDTGFQRKYSVIHYLSMHVGKRERLTFGLFESVTWKNDSLRGFDLSYLNPVIFLRPTENSIGSPDNVMIGGTVKYRIDHHVFYGQLLLDELIIDEVKAGNGWWGNKQAFQIGYKGYSLFGVKNLNVQTEFNYVRPFVYAHRSRLQNYAHYNQALAHPLGANFYESVSFLNYRWKNFFIQLQFNYAKTGLDSASTNYGSDIFKDYETRTQEYGNYMLNGVETKIMHTGVQLQYLVNPKTNLVVKAGVDERHYSNAFVNEPTTFIYFGVATALNNFYFDF
jgi:hypothetical protein